MNAVATEFKTLCEKMSEILLRENLQISPYTAPHVPHFQKLSTEQQNTALETFRDYVALCSEVQAEGTLLRDSSKFIRRALRHWSLTISSDAIDKIHKDDSVEVYTNQNLQIFRNLRFFELCSYSLEEIYTLEWWKLYQREEWITQQLFAQSIEVVKGKVAGAFKFNVPGHVLAEINSIEKRTFWVEPGVGCALFKDGETKAFLFATAARRLT